MESWISQVTIVPYSSCPSVSIVVNRFESEFGLELMTLTCYNDDQHSYLQRDSMAVDVPAGSGLSSLPLKAANALLPPLSSHVRQARWEQEIDYCQVRQFGTQYSMR